MPLYRLQTGERRLRNVEADQSVLIKTRCLDLLSTETDVLIQK